MPSFSWFRATTVGRAQAISVGGARIDSLRDLRKFSAESGTANDQYCLLGGYFMDTGLDEGLTRKLISVGGVLSRLFFAVAIFAGSQGRAYAQYWWGPPDRYMYGPRW